MAEKHYLNDYKRIMGVDESRTASEKLLDRAIRRRDPPAQTADKEEREEPVKKVKRQADQSKRVEPDEAIDKIIKALSSHTHLQRVHKTLQVLQKCLLDKQFIAGVKTQKLQSIVGCLINTKHFLRGSLGEVIKLSQLECSVLEAIIEAFKKYENQQYELLITEVIIHLQLLALITDDSFRFAKNSQVLKTTIFDSFKPLKQAEGNAQEKEQLSRIGNFIESFILSKLILLPNSQADWARSGIINLLKQFIVQYKNQLSQPKQFLAQYNKFMQVKKSQAEHGAADIMGRKVATGGTYTAIETHDSSGTWCKKQ